MNANELAFAQLIAPLNPEQFFDEYWEQRALYIRRQDPTYYDDVVTKADIDKLISDGHLRPPALRLVQPEANRTSTKAFYAPEDYSFDWQHGAHVFPGMLDVDKVFAAYRSGATINLPGLEQFWRPLRDLCVAVEGYLNHAVRVNGYITTSNSRGFPLHYDPHDVFVMQIAGKKRWLVYEPVLLLPLVNQPFSAQPFARDFKPQSAPLLDLVMEPGDLLYLPRGFVHAAATADEYSVHTTIGVTVFTYMNLVSEVLMSCMNREAFRHALPPGFADRPEAKEAVRETLSTLLDQFQNQIDYDQVIDGFLRQVKANKLRSQGSFYCDVSEAPQ